jgi:hypothetical protein
MTGLVQGHLNRLVTDCVDSRLESTRVYWRLKLGASQAEAVDPRPFADVIKTRHKKG